MIVCSFLLGKIIPHILRIKFLVADRANHELQVDSGFLLNRCRPSDESQRIDLVFHGCWTLHLCLLLRCATLINYPRGECHLRQIMVVKVVHPILGLLCSLRSRP